MPLFGNKNTTAFGLDISDTSIKVMQLSRAAGHLVPIASAEVRVGDKIINNHMIVDPEKLGQNIKQAISQARKIDTKYVICSIPEAKSFVRVLSIPKIPETEISGAIPFELEQDIPVPVDQVYLDWQLLRDLGDKLELLVVATPKDYVDSLVEALHVAGLKPMAMELESQATARALIAPEVSEQPILIVDLSTLQTSFIIVDKNAIEYTSSMPIAGAAFTESIARALGITPAAAEKMKQEVGLTAEGKQSAVRSALLPILDNIVEEIKNIIRFFEEHDAAKRTITQIMLCGGSAELLGIDDYIGARINLGAASSAISVSLGNPWVNLLGHNAADFENFKNGRELAFSTVTGLALRGIQDETN